MSTAVSPKPPTVMEVHDATGLVRTSLKLRLPPRAYARIVTFSTIIEGSYAMRLYLMGGAIAIAAVPLLQSVLSLTRDQATATVLVPMIIAYGTVKLLADLIPTAKPENVDRYDGWLLTPIRLGIMGGVGFFFIALGTAVSMPIYTIVHVTWITAKMIVESSVVFGAIGFLLCAISGATLDLLTRHCRKTGHDVPTLIELTRSILSKLESDLQHKRLSAHLPHHHIAVD